MSEQNTEFEKWYLGENCKSSLNRNKDGHYVYAPAHTAWIVWQASAKAYDKEKQEQSAEIAQLKADNNRLREALERIKHHAEFRAQDEDTARAAAICQLMVIEELANEYLAKTPAQCLQAHDDEVIEKCAKVCDEIVIENSGRADLTADQCAKTIRELKVAND